MDISLLELLNPALSIEIIDSKVLREKIRDKKSTLIQALSKMVHDQV